MMDKSRFSDQFGSLPCPAALYDWQGNLLCCNEAANRLPRQLVEPLFLLQPKLLAALKEQNSLSLSLPQPAGGAACAVATEEGPVCLFPTAAESGLPQGVQHYFSGVRERVFQSCLALTALQRTIDSDDPDVESLFAHIRRSQYAALRDAGNVATLSAWQAGERKLNAAPCDIARLVRSLCEAAQAVCGGRIPIQTVGCDTPLLGMVDRELLERALLNLLSNAMTYTQDGNRITVTVRLRGDRFTITVQDRGAGMLPQTLQDAVTPYFSTEPAADGERAGLGLGLSIVQIAASLHGGSLLLTGAAGEGCSAALELPLRPCADEDALHASSAHYTGDSFSPVYVELCSHCILPH